MSIELVILSNHLILCHSLYLLPSIFPPWYIFIKRQPYFSYCIFWVLHKRDKLKGTGLNNIIWKRSWEIEITNAEGGHISYVINLTQALQLLASLKLQYIPWPFASRSLDSEKTNIFAWFPLKSEPVIVANKQTNKQIKPLILSNNCITIPQSIWSLFSRLSGSLIQN